MIKGFIVIAVAIALIAIPLVNLYYNFIFSHGVQEFEAVVKKMKPMTKEEYNNFFTPFVEYELEGKKMTAYYFEPLRSDIIDFQVGDKLTILVNPHHPKVFKMDHIEDNGSLGKIRKTYPFALGIGVIALIVGIVMTVISIRNS